MNHMVLSTLLLAWVTSASQTTPGQCKRGSTPGLSLLAHRGYLHKSEVVQSSGDVYSPSYASTWCPCGGYPKYCSLLLKESDLTSVNQTVRRLNESRYQFRNWNKTAQCHQESCGQDYPSSPFSCTGGSGYGKFGPGRSCLESIGNCLYTTATVVKTADGCGSRECFCAKVPPGQCIAENFPGYTIVQNGAYNVTSGTRWYPVGDGSTFEYPPDLRSWELVGGPGNHACRGDNSSDNNPKHYDIYPRVQSLAECKKVCEQTNYCTGIEYSKGRCEIWKRSRGIFAVEEVPLEKAEFTCLRYGWPSSKLVAVGPPGTSHPCRGRFSSDNHPAHYEVISGIRTIEECKAICSARTGVPCNEWECAPKCSGIEFSPGRCELWKVEIESFDPNVDGFTCLKFNLKASYD